MALDTARLRRRLPEPPADGNPAMDMVPEEPRTAPPQVRPAAAQSPAGGGDPVLDGRSLRATGRTTQLNLKVSPEVKARFLALAQVRNSLLVDLFEDAISALEAENKIHTTASSK